MISAKSSFNKGIYLNAVSRFKWGSFLYFVLLFFSGPFVLLTRGSAAVTDFYGARAEKGFSVILSSEYILFPLLLSIAVPTVVALLIFSGVHNSRHGIFLHSLPTTRKANFISLLCASFTLMFAPIAVIGIIYVLMSFCGFGAVITVTSALLWIAVNIFVLFVMFSIAAFSSYLTGNGIASVVVNACIHILPVIISLAIVNVGSKFIYGFSGDYSIAETIMTESPLIWIFSHIISSENNRLFSAPETYIYIIGAAAVYAMTYLLYKKRKIEACGDVAAFKIFKPILKYGITLFTVIAISSIISGTPFMNGISKWIIIIAFSAVVYFASEMILNKNVRVLKSYKGFVGFLVCFFAVISFFAFTSVFGYETYIPKESDISEAAVYDRQLAEPIASDAKLIKDTVSIHRQLISSIPTVNPEDTSGDLGMMSVVYKLKNGKTVKRNYYVAPNEIKDIMNTMFMYNDFKLNYTGISNLNIQNIKNVDLYINSNGNAYTLALNNDTQAFFDALKKDIDAVGYEKMYEYTPVSFSFHIGKSERENKTEKIFKTGYGNDYMYFDITINGNFTNTISFLKDKGYYNQFYGLLFKKGMYVTKGAYEESYLETGEVFTSSNVVFVNETDGYGLYDRYAFRVCNDSDGEKYYYIYSSDAYDNKLAQNYIFMVPEKELSEYIEKYTVQN